MAVQHGNLHTSKGQFPDLLLDADSEPSLVLGTRNITEQSESFCN